MNMIQETYGLNEKDMVPLRSSPLFAGLEADGKSAVVPGYYGA